LGCRQQNGRYFNEDPDRGEGRGLKVLKWLLTRRRPITPQARQYVSVYPQDQVNGNNIRVVFIGHCTLVVEIGGKRILTDPVFSDHASPFSFMGPKRFQPPGIPLDQIPPVDIVLITHNHYDHLDDATIRRLGDGPEYLVPKGLGSWLRKRGCRKVRELDWWEEAQVDGLRITATPCQHWSKRTFFDARKSLWCGFAVQSDKASFLFIGDSGYSDCFRQIGERLGPFTAAALPIGAYEPAEIMRDVHMTPEEALRALEDVRANIMVPTHYGCFPLTDEDPSEPPRRLFAAWQLAGRDLDHLWMLAPGQHRDLEHMIYIPTVRPVSKRITSPCQCTPLPLRSRSVKEWGIAICPHKGGMVDLEVVGRRENIFEGDDGRTLVLNHITCSGFGDLPACSTGHCPLHDPAFLRSYDLHGTHGAAGNFEVFLEFDQPPEPRWWQEKLQLARREG
jgi:N-acyl-phosphatidylethanolamine-hydrolysing phospholipase D